jgi:hypothetical protein
MVSGDHYNDELWANDFKHASNRVIHSWLLLGSFLIYSSAPFVSLAKE